MRLFCDRGIPCVLFGPSGIELAHAVDERVSISELATVARIIVRCATAFGTGRRGAGPPPRDGGTGRS